MKRMKFLSPELLPESHPLSVSLHYAVALAAVAAAVLLRWILEPYLQGFLPLVTVFAAVGLSVWYGGYGPALMAAVLGYGLCAFLFMRQDTGGGLGQAGSAAALLAFAASCMVIVVVGEKARAARSTLQRDEAERVKVLSELTASEHRSRSILESITDSFFSLNHNWCFVYVNPAAEQLLGRLEADLIGKSLWCEYPGTVGSDIEQMYRRVAAEGVTGFVTAYYAEHDRWYEIRAYAAVDGLSVYFRDVTDQKRLDEVLRASEERRRMAFDAAELGSWNIDPVTRALTSDERFRMVFSGSSAELTYEQAVAALHPDDVERNLAGIALALRPENPLPYAQEYRVIHPDGNLRWVLAKGRASFSGEGVKRQLISFDGTVADITDRKQAQEKLRLSEERFRALFDSMDEGFCVIDVIFDVSGHPVDYRFLEMNPAFERHTGLTNAVGKTIRGLAPDMDDFWFEAYGRVVTTGEPTRFVHEAPALGSRWFDVYAFGLGHGKERKVAVLFKDITARKHAEDQARQADEQLRALADNMPQLAWITEAGSNGEVHWFNKSWLAYTGVSVDDMKGDGWRQVHHPDHADRVARKFAYHVRNGLEWEDTFPLRSRDGSYRWFLSRMNVIRGEGGKVARIFGTGTDITEQREMAEQLRRQADALIKEDRRKDEFLATLAHELRNPLAPIRNSLQIVRMKAHDTATVEQAARVMHRQLSQMTRLVDDLLDVSRISGGKVTLRKEKIELADVIRSAVEATRPLFEASGVLLEVSLPACPIWLDADLTRMAQVFTNLLNNAAKFTDSGGQASLTARLEQGNVRVSVKDSGVGIADHQMEGIFEIFVQGNTALERSHSGLGVGLALVRRFVELHLGRVDVHSDGPEKGSEFTVTLPVLQGDKAPALPRVEVVAEAPKALRILVVDDNQDAANSLAMMLELMEHETRTVHDGFAALESAASWLPDLILLDIGMPGMNGYEVARRIRRQPWGERMTLFALTGWGQEDDRRKSKEAGFDRHLVKPVDPAELEKLLAAQTVSAIE
ncbi:MAG: multi-sensor hybrid histidine kinase [Polaromonas sp.]|nr:multi-sensor hybrid histidine kinase [Polaromonas sp.]